MRRPDGITLLAVWHFVVAGLFFLGLCGMTIPLVAVWLGDGDPDGALVATIALLFGVFVIIAFGGAFALAGWGLWELKAWGRAVALVLAILQLPAVPIGTVIGALSLWYLLSDPDAKAAFEGRSEV